MPDLDQTTKSPDCPIARATALDSMAMNGRTLFEETRHRFSRECVSATNRRLLFMASLVFVWKTACTLRNLAQDFLRPKARQLKSPLVEKLSWPTLVHTFLRFDR